MCLDCTCKRYKMCMEIKNHMGECLLEPPKLAGLKDYPDYLQVPPTRAIESNWVLQVYGFMIQVTMGADPQWAILIWGLLTFLHHEFFLTTAWPWKFLVRSCGSCGTGRSACRRLVSFLKAETFERGQYIIKEGEVPLVCGCTEIHGKPWKTRRQPVAQNGRARLSQRNFTRRCLVWIC